MTLDDELVLARELACAGGRLALRYRAQGRLRTRQKPRGQGPVTDADLAVNAAIIDGLTERFPDDTIVTEESPRQVGRSRRQWFVDPIDGTRNFARGRDAWAVLVGLCIDGQPVLGVVHEPAAGRTCWGTTVPKPRAFEHHDGQAVRRLRSATPDPDDLRLVGGWQRPFSRHSAMRRRLGIRRGRTQRIGSIGLRILAVTRAVADVYVQAPGRISRWDTCGPAAVALAAGLLVTDMRGAPLHYRGLEAGHATGIVVTGARAHPGVVEALRPLADSWL